MHRHWLMCWSGTSTPTKKSDEHFVIVLGIRRKARMDLHATSSFLVRWKLHCRVVFSTRTAKSWKIFETGSNFCQVTYTGSGTSASVALEIIFEVNYVIYFLAHILFYLMHSNIYLLYRVFVKIYSYISCMKNCLLNYESTLIINLILTQNVF